MNRLDIAKVALIFFILAAAVFSMMISGCSSDDDGALSGSGDLRSDRERSGNGKKATMPNQDNGSNDPAISGNCSTYTSYGTRNGGRQAWRIPKKGPEFGRSLKVTFSNGHSVYVADTSHNYRESDGFVFKPGIGPNGEGDADTGTSHGGIYLHAPYGNNSRTAELCGTN